MMHPDIERTMLTGYPSNDYLSFERSGSFSIEDHPIEDMFGSEIQAADSYFVDEQQNVVLLENMRDYLQTELGAVFYEAK